MNVFIFNLKIPFSVIKVLPFFIPIVIQGSSGLQDYDPGTVVNRPNILWLTCEDISPYLKVYGDSTAYTPNLDKLASESLVFTNAYATVPVCAPARSSIITGMYPASIGTLHMRTARDIGGWGNRVYKADTGILDVDGRLIREYSAVVSEEVRCFTEYLRREGYYCTNNSKTDYQFAAPVTAWDENSAKAHYRNRKPDQPFFAVFNDNVTHESKIWDHSDSLLTVDSDDVPLPPYFPDDSIIRADIARNYSNIELLDKHIGIKLKELEEEGLLENTIIFFFSDHGGPMPRGKRDIHDSGLRVPMFVRMPGGKTTGRVDALISFVDLAPTVLSLAGIKPPSHLQGLPFLGKFNKKKERDYIFGAVDRIDKDYDMRRSVRDNRFLYIKNFYPEKPYYQDNEYRKKMPMMTRLLQLQKEDKLNAIQSEWFSEIKNEEELYDCWNDPHNINNIADDPKYKKKLKELKSELKKWQLMVDDKGLVPEAQMIHSMWPNNIQPLTNSPTVHFNDTAITISCTTKGSSIAYLFSKVPIEANLNSKWKLYNQPITDFQMGDYMYVLANRIGYRDSKVRMIRLID